ncbi:hypothetical protein, partial [Klebsiella pneumoniae]
STQQKFDLFNKAPQVLLSFQQSERPAPPASFSQPFVVLGISFHSSRTCSVLTTQEPDLRIRVQPILKEELISTFILPIMAHLRAIC